MFILEELLSPIVTPLILIFCLRPRALEIIDFFRNFTVEVVGVGDTCSFAQMDVRQHGHPQVLGKEGGSWPEAMLAYTAFWGKLQRDTPSEPVNHRVAALHQGTHSFVSRSLDWIIALNLHPWPSSPEKGTNQAASTVCGYL